MADNMEMPRQVDLMWAMLLGRWKDLGGSASIGELDDRVATDMDLREAVLDVVHGDGPQSEASGDNSPKGGLHIAWQAAHRSVPRGPDSRRRMRRRQQHPR